MAPVEPAVVPVFAGAGVVAVVVLVGAVTVVVGAVTVACGVVVVVVGRTVVVCPMLSDWLVTEGVFVEELSVTSTMITTMIAITSAPAPAIAQPLGPVRPWGSGGTSPGGTRAPDAGAAAGAGRGASPGAGVEGVWPPGGGSL